MWLPFRGHERCPDRLRFGRCRGPAVGSREAHLPLEAPQPRPPGAIGDRFAQGRSEGTGPCRFSPHRGRFRSALAVGTIPKLTRVPTGGRTNPRNTPARLVRRMCIPSDNTPPPTLEDGMRSFPWFLARSPACSPPWRCWVSSGWVAFPTTKSWPRRGPPLSRQARPTISWTPLVRASRPSWRSRTGTPRELMSVQDVVGTATGLGPNGELVIYVFLAASHRAGGGAGRAGRHPGDRRGHRDIPRLAR